MEKQHSLKQHLHLNDARCFITGWRSKHHQSWQKALTVLLRTGPFSVSGTIAVSGFTHLRSHRGKLQIMAMEGKELKQCSVFVL